MRAWDKLVAGSTLHLGTAWDHLNAQGGGGSVVYIEHMSANLAEVELSGYAVTEALTASMTEVLLSAEFFDQMIDVNFRSIDLDSNFIEIDLSGSVISVNLSANIIEVVL